MENIVNVKHNNGDTDIFPEHKFVNNWLFKQDEIEEAELAHFIAKVAEKNGMSRNDMQFIYPAILRILKSNSLWAK